MVDSSRELSYPAGVRALLTRETSRRRAIENAIVATFERRGIQEIILPIVDYVDAYSPPAPAANRQSYRFTDREGELLFIRSDFTPMVARALAPSLPESALPLDVFYRGEVVRPGPARLGRSRESFQVGAERIGDASGNADLEMIHAACDPLIRLLGGEQLSVTLTDYALLPLLFDAGNLSSAQRAEVRAACTNRRAIRPDSFGAIDGELMLLIADLTSGRLSLDRLASFDPTAGLAARLSDLVLHISDRGIAEVIVAPDAFDASAYYTGISFNIFRRGMNTPLAGGGRYDTLYRQFGSDAPAVGFTIAVDVVEEAR